jgi:hypothetical protein
MQKLFDEEMHSALQQLMDETIEALQLAKYSVGMEPLGYLSTHLAALTTGAHRPLLQMAHCLAMVPLVVSYVYPM